MSSAGKASMFLLLTFCLANVHLNGIEGWSLLRRNLRFGFMQPRLLPGRSFSSSSMSMPRLRRPTRSGKPSEVLFLILAYCYSFLQSMLTVHRRDSVRMTLLQSHSNLTTIFSLLPIFQKKLVANVELMRLPGDQFSTNERLD